MPVASPGAPGVAGAPCEVAGGMTEPLTPARIRRQGPRLFPVWHAFATVYRVVGTRGRRRSVIVVAACPFCEAPHVHTGKPDFDEGKRTASCHGGRYLVHTRLLEGEALAQ